MTFKTGLLAATALATLGVPAFAADDTLDIVFINDGHVAPYHVAWLSGFEDAIKAYDEAFDDVKITGRWLSAEGSLEKMIQQTEVTINEKPDVMFVNAINVDAFEPLVAKAQAAGITWIAVHSPMDSADYSFTLGDVVNGTNQGLAICALSGGEPYKVAIMLGQAGNPSGEARRAGILKGIGACDNVEVVAEQPADWDTVKAQSIAENWLTQFEDLDAISGVTDAYMYPSIAIAMNSGKDLDFFGYDGDIPILQQLEAGTVKADILLSGTREGWNFVQMAYRIHKGETPDKVYDFFTPLVMTKENHELALSNGFPEDVQVYYVDQALDVAAKGYLEFGPESVK
ncbi:sugar ABC transporter substrate-binding protein [Mameliella alba]|nr:sugar ABC transporter substrate-binding protein [Mameliella alba]MBY6160252.1 sugar ABC transporter substrate-binding protein [Mameliella alba]MBY6168722.1 sugar ABC transporter substrate-binding protein [Mameliella alba]MBY6174057.1 sugar ABC transporter substrate-binding protein [Mameliella alba]MCA0956829.1 sugar ABC transporter substrate-binding protein [Mameliella alba]